MTITAKRSSGASRITGLLAWEALDSRGTPTVACEVRLAGGATGQAIVPSGASTGAHEVSELRDGGERYDGRGVRGAVENVRSVLAPALLDVDAADQALVDRLLREADGTADLGRLGANAILAVSVAATLASAAATRAPLWEHVAAGAEPLLPLPMVNIVSGGAHAAGALDIQDCLVVPVGAVSFAQAIEWAAKVRRGAAAAAARRGLPVTLVADEGGLGPPLPSNRAALELVAEGIESAGLRLGDDAALAIDIAATQLLTADGQYRFGVEGRNLDAGELVDEVRGWARAFPLVSVEDVVGEDDGDAWAVASERLADLQLVGDDLFVTDVTRLQRGIDEHIANAVLVKPNQVGTLAAARAVVDLARDSGYATIVSARSGDTEDTWLADLAVGWRAGQIKVGSTTRSERTAKWNRLLRIEVELGARACFAGRGALAPYVV